MATPQDTLTHEGDHVWPCVNPTSLRLGPRRSLRAAPGSEPPGGRPSVDWADEPASGTSLDGVGLHRHHVRPASRRRRIRQLRSRSHSGFCRGFPRFHRNSAAPRCRRTGRRRSPRRQGRQAVSGRLWTTLRPGSVDPSGHARPSAQACVAHRSVRLVGTPAAPYGGATGATRSRRDLGPRAGTADGGRAGGCHPRCPSATRSPSSRILIRVRAVPRP